MRYFFILCVIIYAFMGYRDSYAQSDPHALIENAMTTTMLRVAEASMEAPDASRAYLLVAIALHDNVAILEGDTPYLTHVIKGEPPALNVTIDTVTTAIFSPRSYAGFKNVIVNNSLATLEKPTPIHVQSQRQNDRSVHPEWKNAPLLEMRNADQFRPDGPPIETSQAFQSALAEVKERGEDVSEFRLANESITAAYWGDAVGTETPPGHWNQIALDQTQGMSVKDRLDVLLALNIALYETGIAAWDTKYHFDYPRPHLIIREQDLNAPHWSPMGIVPLHPEYVSGHSSFSGAAAEVLTDLLGERAFCSTSKSLYNLTRCFDSFHEAAQEAGQSRIYGGIHYQFSNQDGLTLGHNVARHALEALRMKGVITDLKTE